MLETVRETIKQYDMLCAGDRVLCAVSGGADSVALLRALLALAPELAITVCVCHVNHMLRGAEADKDEHFVRAMCEHLSVPLAVERRDVGAYAAQNKIGTEEAARDVRYEALRAAAGTLGANRIALAHTMDDNLETMLFHLARGAGSQGMCGIPPVRGQLIRPFLGLTRAQIEAYLFALGQRYVNDSSNNSADYTRNRIRHEVVPVLREINPRCAEAAGRLARLIRKDEAFLAAQAEDLRRTLVRHDEAGMHLSCIAFAAAPDALRGRILREVLREAGMPMIACSTSLIRRVTAFALAKRTGGEMNLPGGVLAVRQYNDLLFGRAMQKREPCEIKLYPGACVSLWVEGAILSVSEVRKNALFNKMFNTFHADCGKIDFGTLCVRARKQGDVLRLTEKGGHRTLKRLMIDRRVPRLQRDRLAVIADGDGVIAVQGIGVDFDRRPNETTAEIIQFEGIQ